nr:ABC transporter permease [Sneathiella sp.]
MVRSNHYIKRIETNQKNKRKHLHLQRQRYFILKFSATFTYWAHAGSPYATTSMGIFLGTVARSMPQFALLLMLVLLPLQMLSGGSTPRESMPEAVQYIMLAAPNTHFVMLAQAILYRGAGFAAVWPQFLAIAAIGAALFSLALIRFRRTISTMA